MFANRGSARLGSGLPRRVMRSSASQKLRLIIQDPANIETRVGTLSPPMLLSPAAACGEPFGAHDSGQRSRWLHLSLCHEKTNSNFHREWPSD
jgi:hypothetical protein